MVGTKAEMVKLIKDSGVLGKETEKLTLKNFDEKVSFDTIVKAIHKVQDNMGITGTTAKEASETISGSFSSMKAAFENLLVALADGNGDVDKAFEEFLESAKIWLKNLLPVVMNALKSIGKILVKNIPDLINKASVAIQEASKNINWQEIINTIFGLLASIDWSGLVKAIVTGFATVSAFLFRALWELLKGIVTSVIEFAQSTLEEAGGNIGYGILYGIGKVFTNIFNWVKSTIFDPFIKAFCSVFGINSPSTVMIKLGGYIVDGLVQGLRNIWSRISGIIQTLKSNLSIAFTNIKTKVTTVMTNMKNSVGNIFKGMWSIIKGVINSILDGIESMANKVVDGVNAVLSALNKLNVKLPNGKTLGFDIKPLDHIDIPGLDTGTSYVPKDMFAMLHKGESVIPKKFNNAQGFSQMLADAVSSQNFMRVFGNSGMTLVATINVNGIVEMDSRKVGQMVAPSVAKTIKVGGIA